MVSYDVITKSSVLDPRSDSRNWPRSSEWGRQLKERMEEHLPDIRLSGDKPVATHFNKSNHSINNVQVSERERVHGQSKAYVLFGKAKWINRLSTKIPSGLNSKEVRQM